MAVIDSFTWIAETVGFKGERFVEQLFVLSGKLGSMYPDDIDPIPIQLIKMKTTRNPNDMH